MSRYVPTADEQAAIERLTLAGYAVVRQRTYDGLRERVSRAEWALESAERQVESVNRWALDSCDESRRLSKRLTAVVASAASLGVSIQAINDALDLTTPKESR